MRICAGVSRPTVPNRIFERGDYLMPNDIDTAEEIAALKAAVAALQLQLNPPIIPPIPVDSRPAPKKETLEECEARIHQRAIDHKATEAGYMAALEEGCEPGTWRDPCGILRSKRDGKPVLRSNRDAARLAAANELARNDHLRWLKDQDLPIRHGAVISEADDAD
jgi:hypothetical protein